MTTFPLPPLDLEFYELQRYRLRGLVARPGSPAEIAALLVECPYVISARVPLAPAEEGLLPVGADRADADAFLYPDAWESPPRYSIVTNSPKPSVACLVAHRNAALALAGRAGRPITEPETRFLYLGNAHWTLAVAGLTATDASLLTSDLAVDLRYGEPLVGLDFLGGAALLQRAGTQVVWLSPTLARPSEEHQQLVRSGAFRRQVCG